MEIAVVFTEEIARVLIDNGFTLLEKTEKAWHFEDSVSLWAIVDELTRGTADNPA